MQERSRNIKTDHYNSISSAVLSNHLPLHLFRSETIPPAPIQGALDFLPNFAGYSWVGYAASSLLVISHFPSPLSPEESLIGPIFRQVLELSSDDSTTITAVSWSPFTPSTGDIAAAASNCIYVLSPDSGSLHGSFCWSQTALLVQTTKVEALKWTGSGDGIVAGGIEVVLWKNKSMSWEIAWKFKAELPQSLVSATWSIKGPSATAAACGDGSSLINEIGKRVWVCQNGGKSEYMKADLWHPHPVSVIQWRPLGRQLNSNAKHSPRHVLLTCCLDGTVRLWSDINYGRVKKIGKDGIDHMTARPSFSVAAIIEINQTLNGTLGTDVFMAWATEVGGIINISEGIDQFFPTEGHESDDPGRCEWLVGFGPGTLLTFWAIHCLDDISPMRFPRVSLWKRQELHGLEMGNLQRNGNFNYKNQSILNKVVISRNQLFGPPNICSLIQLFPCNSLSWSLLYNKTPVKIEDESPSRSRTENMLSCNAGGSLNIDGHFGEILQVAVHPFNPEVELAVSLDSNGCLLFWSLSTISNCILGLPTLNPTWKLCGKLVFQDSCPKYTSLRWAPLTLDEGWVLLMGHVGGIDCFIVNTSQSEEEKIVCYNLCTIPFTGHGPLVDSPTNIFSIPLPTACYETFNIKRFMLFGVWMKSFKALSWEITLHSNDLLGSCSKCSFDTRNPAECEGWRFENTFAGKRYCLVVVLCSSHLPDPYIHDQVTSFAVVSPGNLITSVQEKWVSGNSLCRAVSAYHMATGYSDGTVKLWRSNLAKSSTSQLLWELVGMFVAHEDPITAISLTDCGRKIATISTAGHSKTVSSLHIWDSVHLTGTGTFILEDMLSLDGDVIAFNWLSTGNGQLLLGVCMENELKVYAQRRCGGQTLLNSGKSLEMHIWFCIAYAHTLSPIHDFFWGPGATAVVVHGKYFCLFAQWLFFMDKKHPEETEDIPLNCHGGVHDDTLPATFTHDNICNYGELSMEDSIKNDHQSGCLFLGSAQVRHGSGTRHGFWSMLEIAETLLGSLPIYHPEALLMNICSGNWKRAYLSVRHLVEFLTSYYASEKRFSFAKSSHIVPQIHFLDYFEGHLSECSTDKGFEWSGDATLFTLSSQYQRGLTQFAYNSKSDASDMFIPSSEKSELSGFVEPLEKLYDLAAITNTEKTQILAIIDLLSEVRSTHSVSAYESLDTPGRRFWVAVRFQQLYFHRRFGRSASTEQLVVDSGLIGWAFQSDCQEILFGSVLSNESSWQEMRAMGVGFWFTNTTQLRTKMEKLARSQYLRNKDPKACALLYIALNRLQVLAGLFKISKDEKDKPLVGFLSRNFQEEKNKAAALKNAYVLMGRHQLELAVSFFLLGGDASSAITVCAKNLGDEQLALVICRLVEGHGGPLESQLISKYILPSAIEKGDYWLASLLEWELGNYYQSFLIMLGSKKDSMINKSALSSNHTSFLDPSIGQYCLTLTAKNCMRNAVGEQNAGILARWASLMAATAYNRCGLPIEALECLTSSLSIPGGKDQVSVSDIGNSEILPGILNPSSSKLSNWLSGDVAICLESHAKLDIAMKYFSKLMMEHPSWPYSYIACSGANPCSKEYEQSQYDILLKKFRQKLHIAIANFELKFSINPAFLINMILVLCNNGLLFIGYDALHGYASQKDLQDISYADDSFLLHPILPRLILKATKEISCLMSRFIAICSITCSQPKSCTGENDVSGDIRTDWSYALGHYVQALILSLWCLRHSLKIFSNSKDLNNESFIALDLFEYCIYFAYTWLQRNFKGLIMMVQPLMVTYTNGHTYEIDIANLKVLLHQITELVNHNVGGDLQVASWTQDGQGGDGISSIPADERWQIIGSCLWHYVSSFVKHNLNSISDKLDGRASLASASACSEPKENIITNQIRMVSVILTKLLRTTLAHISSYHAKQLASLLRQKVENGLCVPTLVWLEKSNQSQPGSLKHLSVLTLDMMNKQDELWVLNTLWDICANAKIISEVFSQENINCSHFISQKPSKSWSDIYKGILEDHEIEETYNQEGKLSSNSAGGGPGLPVRALFRSGHTFLGSRQKDTAPTKEDIPFQNPKELYKRNGELFEALCINSIDQGQAALASNRKGIHFFHWEEEVGLRDKSDYIWSEADWPHNGWAGSESTPVPTCVSPGVGLGMKKGAHLGLGGATVGIPGYGGSMGASGLGWEIQEDFEEFVDPPATVDKISTRAFSSHPSRPMFLVGSSNTHIYLWEFGKEKATATYGVMAAANVPPPYALASISALQFDCYGHRFATAALDGTICTWQLEVGGRSNIRPTESSLCFNSYSSDLSYVTSSGSIIAAAGYNTDGVNVVIWDTLAPPTTSRASITCHEGGARSLSVFDNDIGSGSISPLIVTGGKGGDVGLHDFRYIATGRTKRHGHSEQNGMLWYLPKAHLGSVTKISTIPNTSLFLTGSKDGDVKLWDAKRAKLVHHWSKLHERHTFLQPSSRGFGGVVQAAVTDIQVIPNGFLTCGGDGSVKLLQLKHHSHGF